VYRARACAHVRGLGGARCEVVRVAGWNMHAKNLDGEFWGLRKALAYMCAFGIFGLAR
jgi:hypothetical protein